jgi:hypothetical protein
MAICEMLDRIGAVAKQTLSGKNLEAFLTEVGVAFHGSVIQHLLPTVLMTAVSA